MCGSACGAKATGWRSQSQGQRSSRRAGRLWVAIAIAAAPEAAETAEVQLTAERILHDGKQELSTAEGRAKLVTEGSAVDADRIVYDKNKRIATAVGHVVARITQGGKIAVVADLMTLILDDRQLEEMQDVTGRRDMAMSRIQPDIVDASAG